MCFKPTRFEMLVKRSDFEQNKSKYLEMEKKGIEIVVVPDNYDELVARAEGKRTKSKKKNNLAKRISETVKDVESKNKSWFD